jgi:hypothetical protein
VTSTVGSAFSLGQVSVTEAAWTLLSQHDIDASRLLTRHAQGDWGDVAPADRQANDRGLRTGSLVVSAYPVGEQRVWVVTEPGHRQTWLLLPAEY